MGLTCSRYTLCFKLLNHVKGKVIGVRFMRSRLGQCEGFISEGFVKGGNREKSCLSYRGRGSL